MLGPWDCWKELQNGAGLIPSLLPRPFPAALSSVSSEPDIWEEGKRSGWSPSCWFLPSMSILAYLWSIPTGPAATPHWLAFSVAGETLTPELNAFGLLIMESGI